MILGTDVRIGGTGCPGSFEGYNRLLPSLAALRIDPKGETNVE
jgi:hypothetical protein